VPSRGWWSSSFLQRVLLSVYFRPGCYVIPHDPYWHGIGNDEGRGGQSDEDKGFSRHEPRNAIANMCSSCGGIRERVVMKHTCS